MRHKSKHITLFLVFVMVLTFCQNTLFCYSTYNFSYSSITPYDNSVVQSDFKNISLGFVQNIEINDEALFNSIVLIDKNSKPINITSKISSNFLQITINETLTQNMTFTLTIPGGALKYTNTTSYSYINALIVSRFSTQSYYFNYNSSIPVNNDNYVATNQQYISITFAENIDINDTQLFNAMALKDVAGNSFSDAFFIKNNILQAKINKNLIIGTSYTAYIPSGTIKYKDNSNYINSEITIRFTTIGDTESPYVLQGQYYGNIGIVDPNAPIKIKFNEKIKFTSYKDKITLSSSDSTSPSYRISISDEGDELVITPQIALASKTNYSLSIPQNSITDLYMNYINTSYSISFSVGIDVVPPMVVSTSINNGQQDVPFGIDEIKVNFDGSIKYSTTYADIKLVDSAGQVVNTKKTISDHVLTITLLSQLKPSTKYTLSIPKKALKDDSENILDEDYSLEFTTLAAGTILEIQSFSAIDTISVDAGTDYNVILQSILPKYINVVLADKSNVQLGVTWYDSTPVYDMKKPATYTIKGKIVLSGLIANSKKVTPTVKVQVVDKQLPVWNYGAYIRFSEITYNSAKLIWDEAYDDSYIKEYSIEMKTDGITKKNYKLIPSTLARLSNDKNNSQYNTVYYIATGLQEDTEYDVYLTAYDSQGQSTQVILNNSMYTHTKPTNTTTPKTTPRPTSTPRPTPTPTPKVNNSFKDLKSYEWASDSIYSLVDKGIIKGTSTTAFSPGNKISRADMIVMIVRAFKFDETFNDNFSDVPKSAYYYSDVGIAKKIGIIQGRDDKFYPEEKITREDMFVIIKRAINHANRTLDNQGNSIDVFNDFNTVSDYAKDAVTTLVNSGIVKGGGNMINPKNFTTRAEVAVILDRLYKNIR